MYVVNYWMSHPDLDNDDCIEGEDFDTPEEARRRFDEVVRQGCDSDYEYVELAAVSPIDSTEPYGGPADFYEVARNKRYRKPRRDEYARSEAIMQAGMMGGIEAYNDEMEAWG